ncbi:TetR/AcrR family transcriptional regulator [Mesorhizobium sp. M1A.F.Ca.IN.020.06.1.1]|uniref:TetR/AcrR family transcriptional regulator n=1 Tax=unclassified Mesorhizobium TaxID=325217 RepID=UPI000FCA5543|nr:MULTISPECIES: TetR/AcrR family transcriptional regulator [unclassified Mesorhizobium]RUV06304.1 TetR/AcrR family transcriptional regulator [Mesorhizobium sp. M1A.F.Ca.IN.020.03.2.1]RUV88217.1 TetR/AcrR family transcriptional regulator [Mesorhizobium sp. M1A.F.Ca.IN.020.32.1.1]RUW12377.1 TetR/AcrR family transcriptional regulator [Mesorhizobium sp. M1A.F.Ca.IN.022.05.2.1]RUW18807.1 TetR/AcrR family transcriptional regulator [Mesorhizobium sp. M1A.F.Ca.IN.020.06.1.1]RWF99646.1 MAG: TetR/AcrR 
MQPESGRRSNRDRTEATRADLIRAARKLFTEKSYAETGTPEIVAAAGVTRGALYHHFADKQALLAAVVEQEAATVAAEIDRASPASLSARDALISGSDAYLAAMRAPGRTRLLLLDGPAVLGRAAMDEIDNRHGNRSLREGLIAAMRARSMVKLPAEALAAVLAAAFDRAALAIEAGASAEEYRAVLMALMDGLSPAPRPSKRPAPAR